MNGFLWLGVACVGVLLAAVVFDGLDESFDALDLGPGWLSLPVVAAVLAAFGLTAGALIDAIGPLAVAAGAGAGVGFGWLAHRLSRAAAAMPTDKTDREADLLGSLGRIVTPPSAGRYGEVLLTRPSGPVKVACVAAQPLPLGTEVVVVDVTSSTLVTVEPFAPLDPGTQEHTEP
ncbi:MAG TPA: hypothetical protein VIL48_18930 [Acidimicrobiales bacterium]